MTNSISHQQFTVLNTRPKHQAILLSQHIQSLGGTSIDIPMLEIKKLDEKQWLKHIPENIDMVIFISANAVIQSIDTLKKHWGSNTPIIVAIGKGTQHALKKAGISADLLPHSPNSEALTKHKAMQKLASKQVVLVKGKGGRKVLQTYLKKQQANLSTLEVYQRSQPSTLKIDLNQQIEQHEIDIVIITSVDILLSLTKSISEDNLAKLQNSHWLVLSERIQQKVKEYGIIHISIAKDADLHQTLSEWQKEHREMNKEAEVEKNAAEPSSETKINLKLIKREVLQPE